MRQADLNIRSRLSAARLAPMPQILVQLMEHCQSNETGIPELAELIGKDPALAAKILQVANSSAYQRQTGLVSLEQSLLTIGLDMAKTLCISEAAFHTFDDLSQSKDAGLCSIWKHSLLTALTARLIAEKINYPHAEEAYLAGLLHDVGRLALLSVAPREYAVNFFAQDDDNLCAVEQRTLQLTHAEAGAWMIEQWKLDSFLADSILYHHEPMARLEKSHPLIRIVALADFLASHAADDPAVETAGALCGLKATELTSISCRATEQLKEAAAYLGIDMAAAAAAAPAPVASIAPAPTLPTAFERVNNKLSRKLGNMVLASEAAKAFASQHDEARLLEAVTRSARMLFDFKGATTLLLDTAEQALNGTTLGEHRQRISELSIPLFSGSAIAEAALQGRLTFIGHDRMALSVVEEQLQRMLGATCMVCVPIGIKDRCLGVLIGSAESWQIDDFRRLEGFLQAYAAQAASALNLLVNKQGSASLQAQDHAAEYRAASRRVAHEVNNPLSIIKNYLAVLDQKLARQEQVSVEMSIINEEIDRVGQMLNDLADFQPALSVVPTGTTEVDRTIASVVKLFLATGSVPPTVQIAAQKHKQAFAIDGDVNTVKQIFMNLIKNAVEALPDGGKIDIGNNGLVNRDGRLYVELWIKDNGAGIPADVMAVLFSPMQSTKGEGHRGLGLSIVHGLVKNLHGHVSCRSHQEGTTFQILLPVPSLDQQAASRPQVKQSA